MQSLFMTMIKIHSGSNFTALAVTIIVLNTIKLQILNSITTSITDLG